MLRRLFALVSGPPGRRERTGPRAGIATSSPGPAAGSAAAAVPLRARRLAVDGDSISADAGSVMNVWAANNKDIGYHNFSMGGSGIGSMRGRFADVVAFDPGVISLLIGTNDLIAGYLYPSADDWLNDLRKLVGAYKSALPGVKVLVSTCLPCTAYPGRGYEARRAHVNPKIRAGAGVWHDGCIPLGDHPDVGQPAAPGASAWYKDTLHPSSTGNVALYPVYRAALDAVFGIADPGFASTPDANAVPSREYTCDAIVTGLPPAAAGTAAITGTGTFSRGLGVADATSKDVINGDVLRRRLTASPMPLGVVWQKLEVSGHGDRWELTTAPAGEPITWSGAPYVAVTPGAPGNSGTFADVHLGPGHALVATMIPNDGEVSAVTIGGKPATQIARTGPAGTRPVQLWSAPVTTEGRHTVQVSYSGYNDNNAMQILAGTISPNADLHRVRLQLQYKSYSFGPWSMPEATLVPPGGLAVVFLFHGVWDIAFAPPVDGIEGVHGEQGHGSAFTGSFSASGNLTGHSAVDPDYFFCLVAVFEWAGGGGAGASKPLHAAP